MDSKCVRIDTKRGATVFEYENARIAIRGAARAEVALHDFDFSLAIARDFITEASRAARLVIYTDYPLLREAIHCGIAIASHATLLPGEADSITCARDIHWPRIASKWTFDGCWKSDTSAELRVVIGSMETPVE